MSEKLPISNTTAMHGSSSADDLDLLDTAMAKPQLQVARSQDGLTASNSANSTMTGVGQGGESPHASPGSQPNHPGATPNRPTLQAIASGGSMDSFRSGDSPQPTNSNNGLFSPGTVKAGDDMAAAMRRQPSTPMISAAVQLTIPDNMKRLSADMVKLQKKTSLGRGGFAEVILGEAPTAIINPGGDGTPSKAGGMTKVAVKVMDKGHVSKSAFMNLQQEVDICAGLRHSTLINTHGIYEDEDRIYIVMDLAGGGELFKYMKKFGLEDMPLVAPNFIGEVVIGLEFMLSQGIIHRDVKPENLLLTDDYHVKIADFGCCCHLEDPNQKFAGTALYVAPETITTQKGSKTSDIWSLGCVLYQLFVGRPPFEGGTHYQVIDAIKKRNFEFPPYFPEDAKDLVDRMLTTDPARRIGANGYDEIKAHPFFAKVDWSNITTVSNVTHLNENFDKKWEAFLLKGESVVYSSTIKKERYGGMSIKERILILTDYPRLFYLEPGNLTIKGQVPWSDAICAEVDGKAIFHIHTAGSRVYHFNDKDERADLWAAKINETLKKCQARDRAKFGIKSPTGK